MIKQCVTATSCCGKSFCVCFLLFLYAFALFSHQKKVHFQPDQRKNKVALKNAVLQTGVSSDARPGDDLPDLRREAPAKLPCFPCGRCLLHTDVLLYAEIVEIVAVFISAVISFGDVADVFVVIAIIINGSRV